MPKGYSKSIHSFVIILSVFGAIMVTSASMYQNIDVFQVGFTLAKNFGIIIAGYFLMLAIAKLATLPRIKAIIFPLAIIMGVVLLIPLFFAARGGAKAWIALPLIPFTIQPSEFAKVVVILLFAIYAGDVPTAQKSWLEIMKIPFIFLFVYTFMIVVLQRDLGSGVILFALGWMLFLMPSNPRLMRPKIIFSVLTLAMFGFLFFLISPPGIAFINKLPLSAYQLNRFNDMANPFINRYDSSFQLFNSLIAFTKGNWWGIGLGKSVQKLGYLPVADTDYILAIIVEEIGIFGFIFILIGYVVILFNLLSKAMRLKSDRGKMIVFGAALYLMLHFILNVGGVSATIPLTGVPLLMISAGGSSQLAIMMALGFAQAMIAKERIP